MPWNYRQAIDPARRPPARLRDSATLGETELAGRAPQLVPASVEVCRRARYAPLPKVHELPAVAGDDEAGPIEWMTET